MTEEVILHGDWFLTCEEKIQAFRQRFIITNSDNADGIYEAVPGLQITKISGQRWSLRMEWYDQFKKVWDSSDILREPFHSKIDGYMIKLGGDISTHANFDYKDLVLICKSLDPEKNPKPLPINVMQFTITRDMIGKRKPRKKAEKRGPTPKKLTPKNPQKKKTGKQKSKKLPPLKPLKKKNN